MTDNLSRRHGLLNKLGRSIVRQHAAFQKRRALRRAADTTAGPVFVEAMDGVEQLEARKLLAVGGTEVAINVDYIADDRIDWALTNIMKRASDWVANDGSQVSVDDNLYPDRMTGNQSRISAWLLRDPNGAYPGGVYTAEWRGDGAVVSFGGVDWEYKGRRADGVTHWAEITLPDNWNGNWSVDIQAKNGDQSVYNAQPIRDMNVWMPDYNGQSFVGQRWEPGADFSPFHPLYVERLRGVDTVRMMLWTDANSTTVETIGDLADVDDAYFTPRYNTSGFETEISGLPVEYMVALSNEINADLWLPISPFANDQTVFNIGDTVAKQLNSNLKVYLEYGNEVWVPGSEPFRFIQQKYGTNGYGDPNHWAGQATEMKADFVQFRNAYASNGRDVNEVIRVVSGQPSEDLFQPDQLRQQFSPGEYDAVAVTAYAGNRPLPTWDGNTTPEEMIADITEDYHRYNSKLIWWSKWAQDENKLFLTYEAGQHLYPNGDGNASWQPAMQAAFNHPDMYSLYQQMALTASAVEMDLFTNFTYVSESRPRGGSWGALQYQTQPTDTSPRWAAIQEWIDGTLVNGQGREAAKPLVGTIDAWAADPDGGYNLYRNGDVRVLDDKLGIWLTGGQTGEVSFPFFGADGQYDFTTDYFDEDDGQASYQLLVNGTVVDSWVGDQDLPGVNPGVNNKTSRTVRLNLNHKDTITLRATRGGGELAAIDGFDYVPVNYSPGYTGPAFDENPGPGGGSPPSGGGGGGSSPAEFEIELVGRVLQVTAGARSSVITIANGPDVNNATVRVIGDSLILGEFDVTDVDYVDVRAGAGQDSIDASELTNLRVELYGEAGDDTLIGGALGDKLFGGDNNDELRGGAGSDSIVGGAGNDTAEGGAGNDRMEVIAGADRFFGNAGDDTLIGAGGSSAVLEGLDGNDLIDNTGALGYTILRGQAGNDTMIGSTAQDDFSGGSGTDTVDYSFRNDVDETDITLDNVYNDGPENDNVRSDVENLIFADTGGNGIEIDYVVNNGVLTILGTEGNDEITLLWDLGPGPAEVEEYVRVNGTQVRLAEINDVAPFTSWQIDARGGDDELQLIGVPFALTDVFGGSGADSIFLPLNVEAANTAVRVDGGTGNDLIDNSGGSNGATLIGGSGDDILRTRVSGDLLSGGDGNDTFDTTGVPFQSESTLTGDAGNDTLISGVGADDFSGGGGTDIVDYRGRNDGPFFVTFDGVANDGADGEGDNIRSDVEEALGITVDEPTDPAFVDDDGNLRIVGTDGPDTVELAGDRSVDSYFVRVNGVNFFIPFADVTGEAFVDLGDGDDVLKTNQADGPGKLTVNLGDGNDTLDATFLRATVLGGLGDDEFYLTEFSNPMSLVDAGGGNDKLDSGNASGFVEFLGGNGNDTLGSGRDIADDFSGGAGTDTVDYLNRGADNITVTRDNNANDGIAGEQDNIRSNVENVLGADSVDSSGNGGGGTPTGGTLYGESFDDGEGATSGNLEGGGTWRTFRGGLGAGTLAVEDGKLVISGTTSFVSWYTSRLDIAGQTVGLSIDVTGTNLGPDDLVNIGYRVDGGAFVRMDFHRGSLPGGAITATAENITGNNVQFEVQSQAKQGTFTLDNVKITSPDANPGGGDGNGGGGTGDGAVFASESFPTDGAISGEGSDFNWRTFRGGLGNGAVFRVDDGRFTARNTGGFASWYTTGVNTSDAGGPLTLKFDVASSGAFQNGDQLNIKITTSDGDQLLRSYRGGITGGSETITVENLPAGAFKLEFATRTNGGTYSWDNVRLLTGDDNAGGGSSDGATVAADAFGQANGTTTAESPVAWRTVRCNLDGDSVFSVQNGAFTATSTGGLGVWYTRPIDISGGAVNIALDLAASGVTSSDALRVFYRVDGGPTQVAGNFRGGVGNGDIRINGVTGSNLVVEIHAQTANGTYTWDNFKVVRA
ncbi:MAG: calcium-binding protein [Planctomycetota bacterium]